MRYAENPVVIIHSNGAQPPTDPANDTSEALVEAAPSHVDDDGITADAWLPVLTALIVVVLGAAAQAWHNSKNRKEAFRRELRTETRIAASQFLRCAFEHRNALVDFRFSFEQTGSSEEAKTIHDTYPRLDMAVEELHAAMALIAISVSMEQADAIAEQVKKMQSLGETMMHPDTSNEEAEAARLALDETIHHCVAIARQIVHTL